jgi:hypothetical protein
MANIGGTALAVNRGRRSIFRQHCDPDAVSIDSFQVPSLFLLPAQALTAGVPPM